MNSNNIIRRTAIAGFAVLVIGTASLANLGHSQALSLNFTRIEYKTVGMDSKGAEDTNAEVGNFQSTPKVSPDPEREWPMVGLGG